MWDREGNSVAILPKAHSSHVTSVGFSSDGKYIISSGGKTVRLWRGVKLQSWLQAACKRLQYHPVLKNPETDVAKGAKETCEKYVWNRPNEIGSNEATPVVPPISTAPSPDTSTSTPEHLNLVIEEMASDSYTRVED
ncbi:MAG: WD40 repeat domain-containing protein [Pleurocapsa sp. MO_226.B13]|nr:WD40 repeat domain-containing protein [Pleurocapsa sp. MO_226.B13]